MHIGSHTQQKQKKSYLKHFSPVELTIKTAPIFKLILSHSGLNFKKGPHGHLMTDV